MNGESLVTRVARIEAVTNQILAQELDVAERRYKIACQEKNEEEAASAAREIRNKLLDMSDAQMALDRVGLDSSSSTKFIQSLFNLFSGEWAKYRKALRDLPGQPGFPFDIEFPAVPGKKDAVGSEE